MNYRELFDQVEALLAEHGYAWVAEQAREELATGKLIEERLSTLTEVKTKQMPLVEEIDFKKGQQAEFVRRAEYTPKEGVVLLLEAARRAICDTAVMTEDLRNFLSEDDLSAARFESERDDEASQTLVLSAGASFDVSSAARYASELDELIQKIRAA